MRVNRGFTPLNEVPCVSDLFLMTVSGVDRPGITSLITSRLARIDARVLDIGQSVIHRNLSLGMLVEIEPGAEATAELEELGRNTAEMGLTLRISPVEPGSYTTWV